MPPSIPGNSSEAAAAREAAAATHAQLLAMQALTDTALSHLALDDLLRELLGRVAAPGRVIQLHTHQRGAPIRVEADAYRLGQVVTNYLTNALKYSPQDQPVDASVEVSRGRARRTCKKRVTWSCLLVSHVGYAVDAGAVVQRRWRLPHLRAT